MKNNYNMAIPDFTEIQCMLWSWESIFGQISVSACLLVPWEAKVGGIPWNWLAERREEPPKLQITSLPTLCQWRTLFKTEIGNFQAVFISIMETLIYRFCWLMTDGLRIAHLRIAHQVANPKVGNPEIHPWDNCLLVDRKSSTMLQTNQTIKSAQMKETKNRFNSSPFSGYFHWIYAT